MLPVIEPDGRSTARQAVVYAAALLPVALAPTLVGMSGTVYFAGALAITLLFLGDVDSVRHDPRGARRPPAVLCLDHLSADPVGADDRGSHLSSGVDHREIRGRRPSHRYGWTRLWPSTFSTDSMNLSVSDLPLVNASLNGLATILLIAGYICIRQRRIAAHRAAMVAAFVDIGPVSDQLPGLPRAYRVAPVPGARGDSRGSISRS